MAYKKIHLNIITFLLAALVITGLSIISYRAYDVSRKPSAVIIEPGTSGTPGISQADLMEKKEVKPSRPEDLGIPVYYEDEEPKTQQQWNAFVASSYETNRREFENNYKGQFGPGPYKQLDEADLREIENNRVRIDEKISEYEDKLKDNPDDEESQKRLKNWRKFKAILTAVYGEED